MTKNTKTKYLLYLGILMPIIFWSTTFICGFILGDYNHLSRMVSELGELGTKPQYLFSIGLTLCSILNIFFVYELYKLCKRLKINTIPILILGLFSFLAGPALIPMPLRLHGIVGFPFPFIMLSPVLSIFLWKGKEKLIKTRNVAILSFVVMMFGFLIFFPNVLNEYFGLKQRFLYIGWSLWSAYLGYRFLQINNHINNIKQ